MKNKEKNTQKKLFRCVDTSYSIKSEISMLFTKVS